MPLLLDDMTDPDRPVTRRELREELEAVLKTLATKEDLKAFATKEDLKAFPTREEMNAKFDAFGEAMNKGFDELRVHFHVVAESFKSECHVLFDGLKANAESLEKRVADIETGHGTRLLGLETRVTRLESRRRSK